MIRAIFLLTLFFYSCYSVSAQGEQGHITPQQCLNERAKEAQQRAYGIYLWVETNMLQNYKGKPIQLTIKDPECGNMLWRRTGSPEKKEWPDLQTYQFSPSLEDYESARVLLSQDGWRCVYEDDPVSRQQAEADFCNRQDRYIKLCEMYEKHRKRYMEYYSGPPSPPLPLNMRRFEKVFFTVSAK